MPLLETKGAGSAQGFGLSLGSAEPVYIEQTFSTYLYTGNGSTQTITNGIDLSTKGGLVWSKDRSGTNSHRLYDTVRGGNKSLSTNQTAAQDTWSAPYIMTFNSNGYETGLLNNENSFNYASWTFRKQPKFFDIVTYTGTGATQTVAHNLGSAPGMVIVKVTSTTNDWFVWHRGLSAGNYIKLNTTDAQSTTNAQFFFGNGTTTVDPSSTVITLGGSGAVNGNGVSYVAYLFAHDAGGFGLAGTDNVISCGSYTGAGSPYTGGSEVTLGYEPQWVLIKSADNATNWVMIDNMRGWEAGTSGLQNWLYANTSGAENTGGQLAYITSTGFKPYGSSLTNNTGTYIYIAIRRGPMKVPTVGTSVFSPVLRTGTGATATVTGAGFPVDLLFSGSRSAAFGTIDFDRLRGATKRLFTFSTAAEAARATSLTSFAVQDGYTVGNDATDGGVNNSGQTYIYWNFRRAPGFFDEVCYTGTGVDTNFTHNLSVAPELIITKKRSAGDGGGVYVSSLGVTKYLELFSSSGGSNAGVQTYSGYWLTPTSTTFGIGPVDQNTASSTYVAYLFATCAGVSKVGTYTGNGSSQTIACGFAAGSRFVLIKRTDSTGEWYVWDSARGIVAGNDPHLSLNTTAVEVTTDDSVDTDNSGFIVNQLAATNVNVSSAQYLFVAIS